jgi:histone acetyltransferase (RNA polymerase elongator complex component)
MRHVNIPVFIPHLGCPNQCVFCNQREISGVREFQAEDVIPIIETALRTVEDDAEVEIAFFGGSFTGIDRDLMLSLLEIANGYINKGVVSSIRCSTRPDYIDEDILGILKKYGVKTIELGLQSSSDEVLKSSKRGHDFEAEMKSCRLITENGFNLVGQMMIGLPASDKTSEMETARFIVDAGAVGARIYPTVVFRDTELCSMMLNGSYKPLTLDEAIERAAEVLDIFLSADVEVIRIGLQASDNLSNPESSIAGANHPALGELVIGEVYYKRICKLLSDTDLSEDDNITVLVSRGAISKAVGQNKKNKLRLTAKYKNLRFAEAEGIPPYGVRLEINNGEMKCT